MNESWWDGLQKRLFRRGLFDPFAARHVKDDFTPYYVAWRIAIKNGEDPVPSFRRIFLGHDVTDGDDVPDSASVVAAGSGEKGSGAEQVGELGSPEHRQARLQLVCPPVSPG